MVTIPKYLNKITIDELEHLRDVNRDSLLDPHALEEDDKEDRTKLHKAYNDVLYGRTSSHLAEHPDVMHALEDHMEDFFYESCRERTAIRNDLIAAGHIKVQKRAAAPVRAVKKVSDTFTYNDGGRSLAGYSGDAGDCVTRAVAIASGLPYKEVYDFLAKGNASQRAGKYGKRSRSARNGVHTKRKWFKDYMQSLGFVWVPTMQIGSGCKVHFRKEELPAKGRLIVSLSKHYSTMIDGVINDTYDPSRNGTRCVYGYWIKQPDEAKQVRREWLELSIQRTKEKLDQLELELAELT
jgi:hypothetical protein